ncbi:TetR/AcrR family transcriptional regulator [Nocardioides sp. YIM B13467]|uniref:TetR/AcrR family transcriptional regulator n=1 Tax=Nocardioides sp. YIM B13467 TaxID=3366294 RepID=UPI003670C53A
MTSTTTHGRPRGFDREAALDRAVRLFWRKGYETTSVRELGSELGIGQPSLYNAFSGKRALFDEAVEVYDRKYGGFVEVALVEEETAVDAMRRVLTEAPMQYTRQGLPCGCLVFGGDAGTDDSDVRAWLSNVRNEKTRGLKGKIQDDVSAGVLPEDTDVEDVAAYVMAVLSGLAQRARDEAPRRELEGIARIAIAALPRTQSHD